MRRFCMSCKIADEKPEGPTLFVELCQALLIRATSKWRHCLELAMPLSEVFIRSDAFTFPPNAP